MRALKVSYSDVGDGGVAVNCVIVKKTQFFLNTLYMLYLVRFSILELQVEVNIQLKLG